MSENKTYSNVLITSLKKKLSLLEDIYAITKKQEEILKQEISTVEDMNETIEQKEILIQELNKVTDGFETIYKRVKEALDKNKDSYKNEILQMQGLIKKITDLSVKLQAKEIRNKEAMEVFLVKRKNEIKSLKTSNNTAEKYYQNMANRHRGQSYFVDKRE